MPFTPELNTTLPPNTALLSDGVIFSLESTGFAQRGIARDVSGNILFEGPETASSTFIIFDTLYAALYPLSGNQPTSEWNVIEELDEVTVVAKAPSQKDIEIRRAEEKKKREEAQQNVEVAKVETQTITENTPDSQKPKSTSKLIKVIMNMGLGLVTSQVPKILSMAKEAGIEEINSAKEELPDLCPSPEVLDRLEETINQITLQLNQVSNRLNNYQQSFGTTNDSLNALRQIITGVRTAKGVAQIAANVAGLAVILGPLTSAIAVADTFIQNTLYNRDGVPKLSRAVSAIGSVLMVVGIVIVLILKIVDLLEKLKALLAKCRPEFLENGTIIELNDIVKGYIATAKNAEQDPENGGNSLNQVYKEFTLKIVEEPYKGDLTRKVAQALNSQGVVMLRSQASFTTTPGILIDELKFRIDEGNLNPY